MKLVQVSSLTAAVGVSAVEALCSMVQLLFQMSLFVRPIRVELLYVVLLLGARIRVQTSSSLFAQPMALYSVTCVFVLIGSHLQTHCSIPNVFQRQVSLLFARHTLTAPTVYQHAQLAFTVVQEAVAVQVAEVHRQKALQVAFPLLQEAFTAPPKAAHTMPHQQTVPTTVPISKSLFILPFH